MNARGKLFVFRTRYEILLIKFIRVYKTHLKKKPKSMLHLTRRTDNRWNAMNNIKNSLRILFVFFLIRRQMVRYEYNLC